MTATLIKSDLADADALNASELPTLEERTDKQEMEKKKKVR